jgi:hypothetical protein
MTHDSGTDGPDFFEAIPEYPPVLAIHYDISGLLVQ